MSFRSSSFNRNIYRNNPNLRATNSTTEACNADVPKGQWWEQQQSVVENMVDNDATRWLKSVKDRLLVASANELQLKSKCNEDGYPRVIDCAQRKKMKI